MKPDNEYRHWIVTFISPSGGSKEIARYRRRGDAESHSQALNRLLPDGGFTVVFDESEILTITEGMKNPRCFINHQIVAYQRNTHNAD